MPCVEVVHLLPMGFPSPADRKEQKAKDRSDKSHRLKNPIKIAELYGNENAEKPNRNTSLHVATKPHGDKIACSLRAHHNMGQNAHSSRAHPILQQNHDNGPHR